MANLENENSNPSFPNIAFPATKMDDCSLRSPDNSTANSALEFIMRKMAIPDCLANAIFSDFPLARSISPLLKKAVLLRRLASDLTLRSISEKTLKVYELIEEIDRENGSSSPSDAMNASFCAVALYCTAAALRRSVGDFLDSFNRIWVLRICDMEKSAAGGLISEDLREVRDILWEAVKDPRVRELVFNVDLEETLGLIREYLEEAWQPFTAKSISDEGMRVLGGKMNSREELSMENQRTGSVCYNEFEDTLMEIGLDEEDNTAEPVSVLDSDFDGHLDQRKDLENRNKATELLVENSVKSFDGDKLIPDLEKGSKFTNTEEDTNRIASSKEASTTSLNKHMDLPCFLEENEEQQKNKHLERNQDDYASKGTDSPPRERRIHLVSPKRAAVSPLKLIDGKKFAAKRRKMRKWSLLEEEILLSAVREYGKGNWKLILSKHSDIFQQRTEVDLKDKWRNMMKGT